MAQAEAVAGKDRGRAQAKVEAGLGKDRDLARAVGKAAMDPAPTDQDLVALGRAVPAAQGKADRADQGKADRADQVPAARKIHRRTNCPS
jgi:hypothetical protein